ncbi:MAG: hypothetical protein OEX01_09550 [Candidatus Bathyarchaeota archaeon]|nr:hypothetical protein [Candidatus Bathyarchaeota archaeon]
MVKSRTTVNGLTLSYDEETDEISFEKQGIVLVLKMGEDRLNLLYQMTPYHRYKKFLFMEQDGQCADCSKKILLRQAILHHDPKLGIRGAMYIDFKKSTQNRILCKKCHDNI